MMSTQSSLFTPLGPETAPEASRPLLEKIRKSYKFIPNMFGTFANSPVLLEGYLGLESVFDKGSLTVAERQLVLLAASVENDSSQHGPEVLLARAGRGRLRRQVQPAATRPQVERACRAHEGDRCQPWTRGSTDNRQLPGRGIPEGSNT